jgi:nitrate/nitrite-specific signal transduction histidine kinase
MTSQMVHVTNRNLENFTSDTVNKIDDVKNILYITLFLTLILTVIVSFRLTSGVIAPIDKLFKATRRITAGEYGHTVDLTDTTEFNELAQNFNRMSIAIQESYKGMHNEINKSINTESELMAIQERYSLAA